MEIIIQALMESLHEGSVPFALMLMLIWSWDQSFELSGISNRWSNQPTTMPDYDGISTYNLRTAEAVCSRMVFGKTIKRKNCPDDSDEASSFLFSKDHWMINEKGMVNNFEEDCSIDDRNSSDHFSCRLCKC